MRRACLLIAGLGLALASWGCGARPAASEPARLDVLQQIHLRGAPTPKTPRVALTFDGPSACTADLLARLRAPGEGLEPLVATFFFDRDRLAAMAVEAPDELRAILRRIEAEGHRVALGVGAVDDRWATSPAAFRRGIAEAAAAVDEILGRHGGRGAADLRLWRPAGGRLDWASLGRSAAADRPLVLWTQHAVGVPPELWAARIMPRVGDGDIVALPGEGPGCKLVQAVPALAQALKASGLGTATVPDLLGPALARHEPIRTARYLGPGLTATCADRLGLPPPVDPETVAPRWGLVTALRDGQALVVPLPADQDALTALRQAGAVWRAGRWAALPGCLRRIPAERWVSPVADSAAFWVVEDAGLAHRDGRAQGPPEGAVVLPTVPDLVRLEARQRLPWRLRGLVAGAMERLRLDVPLLIEGRASAGVVVGRDLTAADAASPQTLRAAVAGYVQVAEFSLAEYLFLARRYPAALVDLDRTARALDGFLRAGPFLVTPAVAGGAPHPAKIGPDGRAVFPEGDPARLLARVLAAGKALKAGDVVVAAPPPVAGPPQIKAAEPMPSLRASLRRDLARAVARGLASPAYLRPGSVLAVDGDLLGRLALRVAVPPGVAAPTPDALPLVAPRGGPP